MNSETVQQAWVAPQKLLTYNVTFGVSPAEINRRLGTGERLILLDVREKQDFDKGHLPSAIHLPEAQWKIPLVGRKDAINFLYGYSHFCHRVSNATVEFMERGYPAITIEGGFEAWQRNKLPIEI